MKERKHTALIITEGEDEEGLVTALISHLSLTECDVINAEGRSNLKNRTAAALKTPGPPVRALAIVRDAESSPAQTRQSTCDILNGLGFVAPNAAFEIAESADVVCGYAILPDAVRPGAIEDICLGSLRNEAASGCVDLFFDCLGKSGVGCGRSGQVVKKARVQAYLAACATDRVVHRAGLGFLKGHFDLDSKCLASMRAFLQLLLK